MSALAPFAFEPAPGIRIAGDALAGEAPAYVFLHGLGSVRAGEKSTALFRHAAARGRAALRFDFRGHGDSGGTIGHATISELIADAEVVLARAGPAILVGSSLGGVVAAFLAARHPDTVRGLVLIAPAFGFLPRMARQLDAHGRMRTGENMIFTVHARVLADAAALDEMGLAPRLTMPVLIAHGTDDDVVPHRLSSQFFAAIPHQKKQLWLVPHGDHRLNLEIADILARMDAVCG